MTVEGCIAPGEYEDWELEAYAEGVDLPQVRAHVAHCPACRTFLAENRALDTWLRSQLYRLDCPSPETLRDYLWGDLPGAVQERVADHLAHCPLCSQELERMRAFVAAEDAGTPPGQQAMFAHLLRDSIEQAADQMRLLVAHLVMPPGGQIAAASLRGQIPALNGERSLLFEVDDMAISLMVQKEKDGSRRLAGQVLTPLPSAGGRFAVTRRERERPAVEGEISETGTFVASLLSLGTYQLVLTLADAYVVIPNLAIQ